MDDAAYKNLTTVTTGNSQTYKGMLLGEDADGDNLSYAVTPDTSLSGFTLDANANTYTFVSDATDGDYTASIDVTDDHGNTSTESITFVVT